MFKSFDFRLPTKSTIVPNGRDWLHEIKYDGYRLRVERNASAAASISSFGTGLLS
jgi:bifunctional non-homologous end joining protein LigD